GSLQLRHFLDVYQTHAARALERQARVVAEGRHLDARALAGFNEERPRGNGKLLAVNSKGYVSHGETAVRSSPFANGNSILLSSRARTSVRVEGSASPYRPYRSQFFFLPWTAGPKACTNHNHYTIAGSATFSNGHGLPSRWSSNSLRYFCTYEMIGIAAASPSGQNVRPSMFSARYFRLSMSLATPPPACMRVSVFFIQSVPSRQGMHQPQLSC